MAKADHPSGFSEAAVSREDVEDASARVGGRVRETPIAVLEEGAFGLDAPLILKLDLLQHSGSFKARGAFNRILSSSVPPAGVVAASGGNHGAAVAYAARSLGHRAEVFVPEVSSPFKVDLIRRYGAEVTVGGAFYADAYAASAERAAETGALVVHAYDQPEVVAGQGTLAREFRRQAPALDTVLVAVGGGGLIGGAAIREAQRALWRSLRIVAEPGGAIALAALLSGRYRPEPNERIGVLVCGGNADLARVPA